MPSALRWRCVGGCATIREIFAPTTARAPCAAAPAIHTPFAATGEIGSSAVASSRAEIDMAGKNAMRTGWRHSASADAGRGSALAK